MSGFALAVLILFLGVFSAVGWVEGLISKSKSIGELRSTLVPPLISKKSVFRNAEKSSVTGCGSTRLSEGGDSWFRSAMYWDTLGPRGPLYPDMSVDVMMEAGDGREQLFVGVMESISRGFRGVGWTR